MTPGPWDLFFQYAAFARSKPTFDLEERELPLAAAEAVQGAFRRIRRGRRWQSAMTNALSMGRRAGIVYPQHAEWLEQWAGSEDGTLAAALAGYSDADPVAGFEALAAAADAAAPNPAAALAIGSLLGFALDPHELPVTPQEHFRPLESALGHHDRPYGSVAEEYAVHREFARVMEERLAGAGIPVRDMLDVQALIRNGSLHADFWGPGRQAPIEEEWDPGLPYVSIGAVYRDEGPYLREWIEFHRLVGVERFFLYDNLSEDDHREVLAPYVESGLVVLRDWPTPGGQLDAYADCVRSRRDESRWIAFVDVDEFLFSPTGHLRDALADYEAFPGVGVALATFGPSGHRTKPPGLVTESYVQKWLVQTTIKSVVNPRHVTGCPSVHHFRYDVGSTVDENKYPVHGTRVRAPSQDRLRVNHYFTKSVEEYRRRAARPDGVGQPKRPLRWLSDLDSAPPGEYDDAILRHVPALREALS